MYIERYGAGGQVFFGLHGWSGDHRTFEPLAPYVTAGATLLACDLPGIGQSPPPKHWSIQEVAGDVAEAIRQVGHPVTLIGNCSGANISFFVAQLIPERIDRLITIDVFTFWPWYFSLFVNRWIGRYAYLSTFANPLGRWMTNLSLRGKRESSTTLTGGFSRVDHSVTYRYLTLLKDSGDLEQFRDLKIAADLIYGEKSFTAARESALQLAAIWAGSRVVNLPGAGHLPLMEAPSALARIIFSPDKQDFLCPIAAKRYAN